MTTISSNVTVKRKGRLPLEAAEQRAAWKWLGVVKVGDRVLQDYAYQVPNGAQLAGSGKRRAIAMSNLKAQGLKIGVSDIVIAYPTRGYHGAYIEMKRVREAYAGPAAIKSAVRPSQMEWLRLMDSVGYWVALSYGACEFQELANSYLDGDQRPDVWFLDKRRVGDRPQENS